MLFPLVMVRYTRWWTSIVEWTISSCTASRSSSCRVSSIRFLAAGRSFAGQLFFAPGALVDDLVAPVVGHLLPLARFEPGSQAAGAKACPAVEPALFDTW
jgi:hypothetical protein